MFSLSLHLLTPPLFFSSQKNYYTIKYFFLTYLLFSFSSRPSPKPSSLLKSFLNGISMVLPPVKPPVTTPMSTFVPSLSSPIHSGRVTTSSCYASVGTLMAAPISSTTVTNVQN